jgi:hypothetical protein
VQGKAAALIQFMAAWDGPAAADAAGGSTAGGGGASPWPAADAAARRQQQQQQQPPLQQGPLQPAAAKAQGLYAVAVGRQPGIYRSWDECASQTNGYPNSKYKKFLTVEDAKAYIDEHRSLAAVSTQLPDTTKESERVQQAKAWAQRDSQGKFMKWVREPETRRAVVDERVGLIPCLAEAGGQPPRAQENRPGGSDVEPPSAAGPAISEENRGYRLLALWAQGWRQGQGLGREGTGRTAPIGVCKYRRGAGIGNPPEIELDGDQQRAVALACRGHNIFLTGVAGTGKSEVTKTIIRELRNEGKRVSVAGSTGVAAVAIGGSTLHSLAGCGVPKVAGDFGRMWQGLKAKTWRTMNVLILDEVGMLAADFLEWLDVTVRELRSDPDHCPDGNSSKPFGGIQLVFIGDFAQLDPIVNSDNGSLSVAPLIQPSDTGADVQLGVEGMDVLAFQTVMWREARFKHIVLKRVHRQADDDGLRAALKSVREGVMPDDESDDCVRALLRDCRSPLANRGEQSFGGVPTQLHAWNSSAKRENEKQLDRLPGDTHHEYKISRSEQNPLLGVFDEVRVDPQIVEPSLREHAAKELWDQAKKGQLDDDVKLRVGAEVMMLQNRHEPNIPYSQKLVNGSRGKVVAFSSEASDRAYPVVKFTNGRAEQITPVAIENELSGRGVFIRRQLPLRLAWALTIDKSQGATMEHVVVDLRNVGRPPIGRRDGQAYVALSRARTKAGLQIITGGNSPAQWMTANPLVKRFYSAIESGDAESGDTSDAAVQRFLHDAGLWWHPMLDGTPTRQQWLDLFRGAGGNTKASQQFSQWVRQFPPISYYLHHDARPPPPESANFPASREAEGGA